MMHNKSDSSVVILAAGFSSRMKQAKFSLMFDQENTFLEKIVQAYLTFGCEEIIIVMNQTGIKQKEDLNISFPENVMFVLNKYPERERFYSLQTGLKAIQNSSNVFIQNSDNPFVSQDVLKELYFHKEKEDYNIPTYNGKGGHPILLNKYIINEIISEKKNDYNLKDFLSKFTQKRIETSDKRVLLNINTFEHYIQFYKSGK